MNCCNGKDTDFTRRQALKGIVGVVAGLSLGSLNFGFGQTRRVTLGFCSQLLCIVPYEVTRARGYFAEEGLEVELVYFRGGSAAMQALVGGAVDYAATSLDVALQAFANGMGILRFASTGRLPLFALATAPRRAAEITSLTDLAGRTVGVSALGNADHALTLFLLTRAGIDPDTVQFAVLGPNIFDALRLGQVDAAMVQEPSLTLIREAGGRVLVNTMDLADAEKYLGGPYEFMGVAVRAAEREVRLAEMRALARALARGLEFLHTAPISLIIEALPAELIAGGDRGQLEAIIERNRASLYPLTVDIDLEAARRVEQTLLTAGLLRPDSIELEHLFDLTVAGG